MKICPYCKKIYTSNDYYCLKDNRRLIEYTDEQSRCDQLANRQKTQPQNIPTCPTCGSTNLKKISDLSRAVSVFAWGLASSKIGKQFECKDCGYKW